MCLIIIYRFPLSDLRKRRLFSDQLRAELAKYNEFSSGDGQQCSFCYNYAFSLIVTHLILHREIFCRPELKDKKRIVWEQHMFVKHLIGVKRSTSESQYGRSWRQQKVSNPKITQFKYGYGILHISKLHSKADKQTDLQIYNTLSTIMGSGVKLAFVMSFSSWPTFNISFFISFFLLNYWNLSVK